MLQRYGAPVDAVLADRDSDHEPITGFPGEWLDDDIDVPVGRRTLRATHTPGHTRGHVVFADREQGLMFAGDHVLPHITPSIGFEAASAAYLGDYLGSLERVRAAPDLRLLPAHGPVTDSVHHRVDELLAHHGRRLDVTADRVAAGAETAAAAPDK